MYVLIFFVADAFVLFVAGVASPQKLHPAYADASFECGAAWLNVADRPDQAVPYFHKALDLKPDFAEAAVNLGLAFKSLGRSVHTTVSACLLQRPP